MIDKDVKLIWSLVSLALPDRQSIVDQSFELLVFRESLQNLFRGAINLWPVPVSTPATDAPSFRGTWTRCNRS